MRKHLCICSWLVCWNFLYQTWPLWTLSLNQYSTVGFTVQFRGTST
jgi:hypothetical protein